MKKDQTFSEKQVQRELDRLRESDEQIRQLAEQVKRDQLLPTET
jgi:hypothetical protein